MNSRAKGAAFERLVAKMILEATELDETHCYRTPLSGGHAQYSKDQPADLFISDTLFEKFPFVVEAKHNKTWKPGVMFDPRKQERDWLAQVWRDSARGREGASPLLVMRGNGTEIFAAMPRPMFKTRLAVPLSRMPSSYLVFRYEKATWVMTQFENVLKYIPIDDDVDVQEEA